MSASIPAPRPGYPSTVASLPDHLLPAAVGMERLSKEVLEEHQRERVLSAAASVFSERGYHPTTVDDLVAAASIGVGSFYALFSGKEDCFLRLYDGIAADAERRIAAAAPGPAPWAERVCAGLREILALASEEPGRARIVLVEAQTAGPAAEARYAATVERAAALLRQGRSLAGAGEPLPDTFEDATVAGVAWLLQSRLADGGGIDVAELLPELAGIAVEPQAGAAASAAALAAVGLPDK